MSFLWNFQLHTLNGIYKDGSEIHTLCDITYQNKKGVSAAMNIPTHPPKNILNESVLVCMYTFVYLDTLKWQLQHFM